MNWHEIPRSLQLRYLHAAAITVAQLGRLLAEVERDAGTGGLQALKLMLRRFYGLAAWAGLNGLASGLGRRAARRARLLDPRRLPRDAAAGAPRPDRRPGGCLAA
ncbi:MAG TPA: hypothetical protein VHB47_15855 [Thermoanaerobaculia bacterium]|nr:hypothetical protein [Thermoanaerobaculia bacterium]